MNRFRRDFLLQQLKDTSEWDVLIIGGGATGLGLAVDAATRGYKTLLAEQVDFAKGTSSRSTKLVHGGVRYLAQGNIHLVREALKERGYLLKNAPHLTRNAAFIIPCYSWFRVIYYTIGLKLYDVLAGGLSLGKSKWINKKEVIERLPAVQRTGLKAGVLYHDGIFDDARLAVNLAQTAIQNGAVVLNYVRVARLIKDENKKICGAELINEESNEKYKVKAKVVINATGVFADEVLQMDNPESKSIIRPSQGVHLVLDRSFLDSDDAIMIPRTDDGRVLFAVPWHEKVLVGTTDTPLKSHSLEPRALEKEIDFILENAGRYFSKPPSRHDVLSVYAGLRPLAATEEHEEKTKEISRSHKVIFSGSNLVSVIGGKWTTYRKMAEDTFTKIIRRNMLPATECITSALRIFDYTENDPMETYPVYGPEDNVEKIALETANQPDRLFQNPISIHDDKIVETVRYEMARTVEDVLARRIRILFLDAKEAWELAPKVADVLMKELDKDELWKQNQVEQFRKLAEGYMLNK